MIKKLVVAIIIIIISSTIIMIGCKSNEINGIENENSITSDSTKEIVDNEMKEVKLGNSIQNILNGGLVAYDEEYIYYNEGRLNEQQAIYQKNIKTNEVKELVNEYGMYINIYEDYIYYVSSMGAMIPKDEIIRVKRDGTGRELIASKEENVAHTSVQSIGDYLYYAVYVDGNSDTATKMDLMKMDLKTLEKHKIVTVDKGRIISINNNGAIDTYLKEYIPQKGDLVTKKIESKEDKDITYNVLDISDKNIISIVGIYNDDIYYLKDDVTSDDNYYIERRSVEDFNGKVDLILSEKYIMNNSWLVGKDGIYYENSNKILIVKNFQTEQVKYIKHIDLAIHMVQRDDFALKLFEIKGDLAYYNSNRELVIDKDINIVNGASVSLEDSEFNIFKPNRKLTQDEAAELAYYRIGERLTDNRYMTEFEGRECFSIMYTYKESAIGFIKIDLNSGEVNIDNPSSRWEKYTKTKEEIEIGTGYGWEDVN